MLAQILDLLCHLVNYGYYDDTKDIEDVLTPLINLLDGKSDSPGHSGETISTITCIMVVIDASFPLAGEKDEEWIQQGRMKNTAANRAVFAVKMKYVHLCDGLPI